MASARVQETTGTQDRFPNGVSDLFRVRYRHPFTSLPFTNAFYVHSTRLSGAFESGGQRARLRQILPAHVKANSPARLVLDPGDTRARWCCGMEYTDAYGHPVISSRSCLEV
jgi:hypothetical protein